MLDTPHLHCAQWDPSLVLGLLCYLRDVCLMLPICCLPNAIFHVFTRDLGYRFNRKRFNREVEQRKKFFIIVLDIVLQLSAYIPSCIMRDHSTVVRLKKYCVFVDFSYGKISMHQGWRKVCLKKVSMHKGKESIVLMLLN